MMDVIGIVGFVILLVSGLALKRFGVNWYMTERVTIPRIEATYNDRESKEILIGSARKTLWYGSYKELLLGVVGIILFLLII